MGNRALLKQTVTYGPDSTVAVVEKQYDDVELYSEQTIVIPNGQTFTLDTGGYTDIFYLEVHNSGANSMVLGYTDPAAGAKTLTLSSGDIMGISAVTVATNPTLASGGVGDTTVKVLILGE